MSWIMVDVESDGPSPGHNSMIALGAVVVRPGLKDFFLTYLRPETPNWVPEALAVSGFTRVDTEEFPPAREGILSFRDWITAVSVGRPMFVSDNNGFDFKWVDFYFHKMLGTNPFGHSSTNLGSLYKGLVKDMRKNFKHLRDTKHTHNPVDDARGNAEAMLKLPSLGLNIQFD